MSLLSAVNLGLALLGSGQQQLSSEEQRVWERISPQVVYLQTSGRTTGAGALIDSKGIYIAHRAAVFGDNAFGRMPDGRIVTLKLVGYDELTQLVALQLTTDGPTTDFKESTAQTTQIASRGSEMRNVNIKDSIRLIGVSGIGPFRAELTDADRLGITGNQRRGVILSEIRFEQPTSAVTGSLLFDLNGKFVGVLGATVMEEPTNLPAAGISVQSLVSSLPKSAAQSAIAKAFGPGQMNVAYAVAPEILERVVEGFASPDHKVYHPALGIQCKSAPGNSGAQVMNVAKSSPAEEGGMRTGDVIAQMADTVIDNQYAYTRFILRQRVGSIIQVKIKRGDKVLTLPITVGS